MPENKDNETIIDDIDDTNVNNTFVESEADVITVSEVYPDRLMIVPIEPRPVFPGVIMPYTFSGEKIIRIIKEAWEKHERLLGIVLVEEENRDDFFKSKLYEVGTVVKLFRVLPIDDNYIQVIAQGLERFKKVKVLSSEPLQKWEVEYIYPEEIELDDELRAYNLAVMSSLKQLLNVNPFLQEQLRMIIHKFSNEKPDLMIDIISGLLSADGSSLQELLECFDVYKRAEKLLLLLKKEIEISQLQQKINKQIEEKVSKQQKEYFLREQLKAIKKELGLEKDDKTTETDKIKNKMKSLKLSKEASEVIDEELEKLSVLDPGSSEYHITRTYLNTLVELPWGKFSKEKLDVKKAAEILDNDHYGLDDVKNHILEFISTIIKRKTVSGSIICLVGPPGVGKTSIGKSIASALNRKFFRFSVGGMHDEAEIKGHRRTYIGAMPGKIIQSLKRVKVANPVVMLDEIDKIGTSYKGDPASALLEVLDPEQNKEFLDHYLDVRFDLSNILFVTTANQLDTIPTPLLDRMEIIKLSGYILEEKIQIAKKFLIPKQLKEHGLIRDEIRISSKALKQIIDKYAREAGVRNLENQIKKIMRNVTLKQARGRKSKFEITSSNYQKYLGREIFTTEQLYKESIPGVTLGLAWTSMGGATLYIEATGVKSKNSGFKQTGQLGKVMQESSEIAYSYVRSILCRDDNLKDYFDENFIHLHVPAGATPKDGPSAGVTMALALYSLVINKPIRQKLAMTGELTLTGKVLPIGGVKEKVIAARRVGVYDLIIPIDNKKDFENLPDYIKKGVTVSYADFFNDVIDVAYREE